MDALRAFFLTKTSIAAVIAFIAYVAQTPPTTTVAWVQAFALLFVALAFQTRFLSTTPNLAGPAQQSVNA
jgi:hypothetical protein